MLYCSTCVININILKLNECTPNQNVAGKHQIAVTNYTSIHLNIKLNANLLLRVDINEFFNLDLIFKICLIHRTGLHRVGVLIFLNIKWRPS